MLGIVGLGYVGFTSLLGFTQYSSKTIGYDVSLKLIDNLKGGKLHISDDEMNRYYQENFKNLNLTADISDLSKCTDIIVAVPTEASESGLDLSIVESVLEQIASFSHDIVIWIRSTIDDPNLFNELSKNIQIQLFFFQSF